LQLEIYDQVWTVRNLEDPVQKEDGGVRHSNQGIELAKQIVKYLKEIQGTAECFPYDEIQELREAFYKRSSNIHILKSIYCFA